MHADPNMKVQQALRLQRFVMALLTYFIVIAAVFLADRLGFGSVGKLHWGFIIGCALIGNGIFFLLFHTGTNLRFADPSLTWLQICFSGAWGLIGVHLLYPVRPVFLMFFLPAFSFGMLRLARRQYMSLVGCLMGLYVVLLAIEMLQRRQSFDIKYELFVFAIFGIVLTWFALFGGFISDIRRRLRNQNELIQKTNEEIKLEIEERKRAQIEKDHLIVELKDALSKVKTLSGLLPICSACKKIRDDRGYWNQLESYIHHHSEAEFSHSICPDCARKILEDIASYPKVG